MNQWSRVLGLLVILAGAANASAQAGKKPDESLETQTYYIFASSNRTSGLTDEGAAKKLESFEQSNAVAVTDRVACGLTHSVGISGVLGIYDKTSANSFLTKIALDHRQMEYLASLIGLYEQQRYVLAFSPARGGSDRLWIITTAKPLETVTAQVRQQHMTPLSVRIEKSAVQIWIVDLGDKFAERPKDLAAQLGGTVSSEDGSAQVVGDQKGGAEAKAAYRGTIYDFEQHSELHFSSAVNGDEWQKAAGRSCSVELPE